MATVDKASEGTRQPWSELTNTHHLNSWRSSDLWRDFGESNNEPNNLENITFVK